MRARGVRIASRGGATPRAAVLLVALAAVCAAAPPAPGAAPAAADPARVIALEVAAPGPTPAAEELARRLGPLGIHAARTRCADARLREMQPTREAPIDFRPLDQLVGFLGEAGFRALWICVEIDADARGSGRPRRSDAPPVLGTPADLAGFAAALVERYDGDGVDDMPGLRGALRVLQIGGGYPAASADALDAYLDALAEARAAAHAAAPDTAVVPAAWSSIAVARSFAPEPDASPEPTDSDERISVLRAVDYPHILDRTDAFDALHLDGLADAAELERALVALRGELARRGARVPILMSQVVPTPLVGFGPATRCDAPRYAMGAVLLPASEADRCRLAGWFRDLLEGRPEAVAWARERAASDLAKKLLVAAAQGVAWIAAGSVEDAALWQQPALEAAAGLSPWGGLLDLGAGTPQPAFAALEQLMRSGVDRADVTREPLEPAEAHLYRVGDAAWVAWCDPPQIALPGDPKLKRIVSLAVPTFRVRVVSLEAPPGADASAASRLAADDGTLRLELTAYPVLVVPEP